MIGVEFPKYWILTMKNLTLGTLKKETEYIFTYLAENYGDINIPIEDDFCWYIPEEAILDITNEPKDCTLASLYDAIQHLEELNIKPDSNVPSGYSLKMLSLLLRYVSDKI